MAAVSSPHVTMQALEDVSLHQHHKLVGFPKLIVNCPAQDSEEGGASKTKTKRKTREKVKQYLSTTNMPKSALIKPALARQRSLKQEDAYDPKLRRHVYRGSQNNAHMLSDNKNFDKYFKTLFIQTPWD